MNGYFKYLRIGLALVFASVFIFSVYKVVDILREYREGNEAYEELNTGYVTVQKQDDPPITSSPKPSQTGSPGGQTDPPEEPEPEPEKEPLVPIEVDFDALLELNKDVIGWLYSEDTVISLPVVQSKDNAYYLRRLLDGKYNRNGTLFMDYRVKSDLSGLHSVIYGHNMKNSAMFGTLPNYKKQSYYDEHPVIYLLTPDVNYRLELFAGYTTNALSDTYTFKFASTDEYSKFINEAIKKSTFKTDVEVTAEDHILTLSTCTYEFDIARYVLMGKLVPILEDE